MQYHELVASIIATQELPHEGDTLESAVKLYDYIFRRDRLSTLTAEQRRDLLEILEDRHGSQSTIVTSQVPIENWHDIIGDPTIADANMDRLVHGA